MKTRLALAAAVTLIMAGCAHVPQESSISSIESAQKAAVASQLDAAIERVRDQPRWSASMDDKAQFASFATDAVSVSYQGSASNLMKAIAAARGKTFKETGAEPRVPIFVFIKSEGVPYIEFMQDMEKQFGQRAEIVLSDTHIELRYRN